MTRGRFNFVLLVMVDKHNERVIREAARKAEACKANKRPRQDPPK